MNWYIAKIIFRVISGEDRNKAQFDEQLRLIKAAGEQQAFIKASRLGKESEEKLAKAGSRQITWQFINVAEINPVSALTDGAELYYQMHETAEAELYIAYTNHQAALLQLQY